MTYIVAKLCVGLLQTWMILEIALRIAQSIPAYKSLCSSASFESWMLFGQYIIVSISSVSFAAFVIFEVVSARYEDNMYAFEHHYQQLGEVFSYFYLIMFIMMASVNVLLVILIRVKERSLGGIRDQFTFKKEKCNLAIILFFFELSYLLRFIWDNFIEELLLPEDEVDQSMFPYSLAYDSLVYVEGLAFMTLLLQHTCNFRTSDSSVSLVTSSQLSASVNNPEELVFLD